MGQGRLKAKDSMLPSPRYTVTWKTLTWLFFNLGAQALPILFLWLRSNHDPKAFWQYVNCTLAALIAIGMLFAALSDLITDNGRIEWAGRGALAIIVVIAVTYLHRIVYDDFLKPANSDLSLFVESVIFSGALIAVGTFLKARMWLDQSRPA